MATPPRDLLTKLLGYIEEQAKVIDPRGFQLSKIPGFRCLSSDIAGLPGIETDIALEGDHVWLRIARLEASNPPRVPPAHSAFINTKSDPNSSGPVLSEAAITRRVLQLSEDTDADAHSRIESHLRSEIESVFSEYSLMWKSWAEGEKPRRKTISLYGDLFALKHQMEAEETARPVELVWGIGISTWRMPFSEQEFDFQYPLLTQAAEISLDEKTMVLEIRARATETRVELDAFITCDVARAVEVEKAVREHLDRHKDRPATPFDASSYTDVLKLVATNLDSEGVYKAIRLTEEPRPEPGFHLVVTDDWAIFSRPRANNYLIEDLRRLRERLSEGCTIPPGPLALVSPPSDQPVTIDPITFRGISSRGTYDEKQKSEELYFPLAYNNEQVTIVQRLERAAGITVQGPPGTGKTHTIANIICHYIATGRRVLVTSRGEPALGVLQSKIPEEVRPLTVALLTSDREGIRQFQGSIEAIQHRVSQLNPDQTREEIELLRQSIDRVHVELVEIDRRIDEIALAQLSETNISGAPMRAQRMAELVVSGRELYGWFDDELSLADKHAPPLSEDEGGRLREYRRKLGSDLIYVRAQIPSADELPSVNDVEDLHNVLCGMREIETAERTGRLLPLRAVTPEVLEVAREMLEMVNENKSLVKELEEFGDSWPLELRRRCRQAEFKSERAALETLFGEIDVIVTARADFLKRPVDFPHAGLNSPKAKEALNRAAETGKPFGFFDFLEGDSKKQIAGVRVAGLQPKGSAD